MKSKTIFIGLSLIITAFIAFGCRNTPQVVKTNSVSNDTTESAGDWFDLANTPIPEKAKLWLGVQGRFRTSITKETLKGVQKLNDFIEHYPVNWISDYDSVRLTFYEKEKTTSLVSRDNILTASQKKQISSLDYSSSIEINVFFKEENTVTKKMESKRMRRSYTLVPETPAFFEGGNEVMIDYLMKKCEGKLDLTLVKPDTVGPENNKREIPGTATVFFVVNSEGQTEQIRMGNSSNNSDTDAQMQQVIKGMPSWNPAKNSKGEAVSQEFEFAATFSSFGGGC